MERGEIWWADIPDTEGSAPAFRRPVIIIQADSINRSRLQTVIIAIITGDLTRAGAPGNVAISSKQSGLSKDSVINVSQLFTLDRNSLIELVGPSPARIVEQLDNGLRMVLGL